MAGIVFGCIAPHPPLLVTAIGGGQLRQVETTTRGMETLADEMTEASVQTIILISPHSPSFHEAMGISTAPSFRGDFANFGVPEVYQSFQNDTELVKALQEEAASQRIPLVSTSQARFNFGLDWGLMVPMHFLRRAAPNAPLVPLSFSWLPYQKHFTFGQCLRRAAERVNKRAAVVASGDMSHRLTPGAPAGYDPMGKVFDEKVLQLVGAGDAQGLMTLDSDLVDRAGECGLRSAIILMGALEGLDAEPKVISYEGPFGVGYLVASFKVKGGGKQTTETESKGHPLVELARQAVETYVTEGRIITPPKALAPEMKEGAGTFVSLKIKGQLRGCIGTYEPTCSNVAEEIIHNAIGSATRDPRFPPVRPDELKDLTYSADILTPPERISAPSQLDPKRYGVIVQKGSRRGLLLPYLEGVDTVEKQIDIAYRKAGITPDEQTELFRFEVRRYQ